MNIPEDDEFLAVAKALGNLVEDGGMTPSATMKLKSCIDDLHYALKELYDHGEDEEDSDQDQDHEDDCPSCAGAEMPKIIQICPAPAGLRAVFAEADSADPTKMLIEDVAIFGVIELPDGSTDTTGITVGEESMVPCEMVRTFIGYLKPGQNPETLAGKVREFLKNNRK